MIPCISLATTLSESFAADAENYPAAGCPRSKCGSRSSKNTSKPFPRRTRAASPTAAWNCRGAYQGGLLLSQGEQRKTHFDHFKRRLDLCQTFRIRTLILAADFAHEIDAQSLGRAVVSLAQAAQWATGFGVRLALEFRGTDAFCSCLDTALALAEQCREPNVGVCLDAFHYYKGPSKPEDLDRLTPANLFHVQVCDVAGLPRELMTDADRVMPGDGDFRLEPIVRKLKSIGYAGAVSLELMNPELWRANPKQVIELGLTSLERLLAM